MSKELNETQNASVGMMVGMIEVCDEVLRAVPCEKFVAVLQIVSTNYLALLLFRSCCCNHSIMPKT